MRSYWKTWIAGVALFVAMFLGAQYMYSQTDYLRVDKSRNATLVQAYEYSDKCGSKGRYNCSAYKGRFLVEPEHVYVTQKIDGFFYHNFIDKGAQPMAAYVSVNKLDLGAKEPPHLWVWEMFRVIGFIGGLAVFFIGGISCLIEDQERRDRRRFHW